MKTRNAVSLKPKPFGSFLQLLCPHRVVGQLLERRRRLQVEEPPEVVVARHAALADPQDVGRGEVDDGPVGTTELLQEARIVVQRDRARVCDPERVEGVDEADLVQPRAGVERAHRLLDRRGRIEAVDLVEVDVIELEAAQALLQRRDDVAARRAAHVGARPGLAERLSD